MSTDLARLLRAAGTRRAVIMQPIGRRSFLGLIPGAVLVGRAAPLPNRPKVSGTLSLQARRRMKGAGATEQREEGPKEEDGADP